MQFLNAETDTTFAHVGCLAVLDPSTAPDGAVTLQELRALLDARLPALGPLRWRLHTVPLGLDLPYWEEVAVDLGYHVREVGVVEPGGPGELADLVGRLAGRPLDRKHPLWECYLVGGLAEGGQALYLKVHHAAVDGVSVADVLGLITDTSSSAPLAGDLSDDEQAGTPPGTLAALGRGVWNAAARSVGLVRGAPHLLPAVFDLPGARSVPGVSALRTAAGAAGLLRDDDTVALPVPPRTVFNGPITAPPRRVLLGAARAGQGGEGRARPDGQRRGARPVHHCVASVAARP